MSHSFDCAFLFLRYIKKKKTTSIDEIEKRKRQVLKGEGMDPRVGQSVTATTTKKGKFP